MANDIAKLGFSADTSDLKKAKADLNAIVPPAEKVERAAKRAGDALSGMGSKADAAAAGLQDVKSAAGAAASGTTAAAGAADKAAAANTRVATGADAAARAIKRAGDEALGASGKLARLGSAANDNLNAVQATPANIAAQFQDIGVTAAAGMNPLLIALQQGTQLSVAFSNGFSGIGAALAQIFSPVALLTIGMVALVAAGIQMIDWVTVGKTALNGLADALEATAPYAAALAAGLLLINTPAILTGIVAITKGVWGLAAGLLAVVGIPTLIVAGLVAIVAAANYFRADMTRIFGFDIVAAAKKGANAIIGFFVSAFNFIIDRLEGAINSAVDGINTLLGLLPDWMKVGSGKIGYVNFGNVSGPANGDYVGKGVEAIQSGAKYLAGKLRGIASGLGKTEGKDKKGGKGAADRAGSGGKTDAEKFSEIVDGADRRIANLQAETRMIGLYGEALATAKARQDLIDEASRKGIVLDLQQVDLLDQKAKKIGEIIALNENKSFMQNLIIDAEKRNAQLQQERNELGLTGAALLAYRYEQEILNDATAQHIVLSDKQMQAIKQTAGLYGEQAEAAAKARKEVEFDQAATRGFFRDLIGGARDGQTALQAFGNAFNNIMDKIIDKLLNEVLDAIFKVNSAAQGGGSGGFLGFLTKALKLAPGGSSLATDAAATIAANPSVFAKGDSFTNSVVGRPTAFAFGRGGSNLGIMGEKNPEAVMPLQRGPDGSLGVQMYGGAQQPSAPAQGPVTFDMRGAVVTQDLLEQMNQMAADRADVAVIRERTRNLRAGQRKFGK